MKVLIMLLFIISAQLGATDDFIRLINDASPIDIELTNQQETLLEFDFIVHQTGISNDILEQLSSQFVDSRLWLRPINNFASGKLLVKDTNQQIRAIILLSATSAIRPKHYKITTKRATTQNIKQKDETKSLNYVDITRFLAQKLYAPERLIKDIGLKAIFISSKPIELFTCSINLACNGAVLATPILQYSDDYGRYGIAIKLINQTNRLIHLDPRDIVGNYLSASFQFNKLAPKGGTTDTSVVYLVSAKPL